MKIIGMVTGIREIANKRRVVYMEGLGLLLTSEASEVPRIGDEIIANVRVIRKKFPVLFLLSWRYLNHDRKGGEGV